ncbi:hypothetical protein [Phyllobacterium sp. OV277]|jgi:hypothetical protein|uniref:hypothetical protein n=1 Tax=Phyllobacterium sp. OV277 TaxID=1882772 RepID=UPI00088C4155|nr:hypothetical protein [Phyllobacterium sp. OV277]SDO76551.1 hypothetical protein SAMN05443582_1021005 [Phyllobacterium sp. OV277]
MGLTQVRLFTNKMFAENVPLYLKTGYRIDRKEPFMGGFAAYMSKPVPRTA